MGKQIKKTAGTNTATEVAVATKSVIVKIVRYSDDEQLLMKLKVLEKLNQAYKVKIETIESTRNKNGTDDTGRSHGVETDGAKTYSLETNGYLATHQKKNIKKLEKALLKFENGTYGICEGKCKGLIPKERLKIEPGAENCIECELSRQSLR